MRFARSIKIAPSIPAAGSAAFKGGTAASPEAYGRAIRAIREAAAHAKEGVS